MLGNRLCLGYSLIGAFSFGCIFTFISGSSLLMMGTFQLSSKVYTLTFGGTALAIMGGSFLGGRLSRHGAKLFGVGLPGMMIPAVAMVPIALTGHAAVSTLLPPIILCCLAFGMVLPNAAHCAIEPLPELTGTASAVFSSLQMLGGALASSIIGLLPNVAPERTIPVVMAVCACAALVVLPVTRRTPTTADHARCQHG